jgi:hypothetical protein
VVNQDGSYPRRNDRNEIGRSNAGKNIWETVGPAPDRSPWIFQDRQGELSEIPVAGRTIISCSIGLWECSIAGIGLAHDDSLNFYYCVM